MPETAIEALYEAILHRFAGLDVMLIDTGLLAPFENGHAGQLCVSITVPLDLPVNCGRVATQLISDLLNWHFGFPPLRELAPLVQLQMTVMTSHSYYSMQLSIFVQNLHFVCESTKRSLDVA